MGIFNEGYSTVDLARILGVHRVTVTKWIKNGALQTARTPGGRYVVSRENLIEFLKTRGIPIPPFLRLGSNRLLVAVTNNKKYLQMLKKLLVVSDVFTSYNLETYSNPYEAITHIKDSKPDLLFLDLELSGIDGSLFIENVSRTSPHTQIIAMISHKPFNQMAHENKKMVAATLKRPFDLKSLKNKAEDVLYGRKSRS